MDKTGRNGLRVGDTTAADFKERYRFLVSKHAQLLKFYNYDYRLDDMEREWFEGVELLRSLVHIDSEHLINQYLSEGKNILAEGAQGSLLDIDFGSYPFVTSSNTITAGACTGLGIAPRNIGEVMGIFKAYCTRVGSGPFPTEQENETGERLRKTGCEFGATTGRPRRCGWLDLPALRYAIMINGVTQLIMTKADVLSGFKTVKVCTHYRYRGKTIPHMPYDIVNETAEPVYKELKGWDQDLCGLKSIDALPRELHDYIAFIEAELNVPVTIVSVGPDRLQTLVREKNTV
jgi:adenylosuccinate synthase